MATPQPLDCLKTVCRWKTPAHCPDWDKMLQMLFIHTAAEDGVNTVPPATTLTNTKLERLARPSFDQDMSQSEWLFDLFQWNTYISQWNTYISQSIVSEGAKVQQLKM